MNKKIFIFAVFAMLLMPLNVLAAPKTMPDGGRFDAKYYASTYPEIAQVIGTDEGQLYLHYQVFGKAVGLMPFDILEAINTPGSVEAKKLANLNEATLIAALQKTKGIGAVEACTEAHDANGRLNKQGGYISSVYFEITEIDQKSFLDSGKISVVDRGTVCGGNIEIYNNASWCKARNDYLGIFDGGFDSGSHYIYGNSIYRISRKLSATQQNAYTLEIIKNIIL